MGQKNYLAGVLPKPHFCLFDFFFEDSSLCSVFLSLAIKSEPASAGHRPCERVGFHRETD